MGGNQLPGLIQHQVPKIVQLTSSATPDYKQYPMTLETKREIAVHVAWLGETGILVSFLVTLEYTSPTCDET